MIPPASASMVVGTHSGVNNSFFGSMLRRKTEEGVLTLPVSEALHDEKRIPLFDQFKPWLVTMAVILVLAYTPALINATSNPGPGAPRFNPDNPVPIETPVSKKAISNQASATLDQ